MSDQNEKTSLKSMKVEPDVHAWLLLLAEKYQTTLSGVIRKIVNEHEPEIVELQEQIDKLKEAKLHDIR